MADLSKIAAIEADMREQAQGSQDGWLLDMANQLAAELSLARREAGEPTAWLIGGAKEGGQVATNRRDVMEASKARGLQITPLYAHPSPVTGAIPEGFVLVPIEPTNDMHEAAFSKGLAAKEGDAMSADFVRINDAMYRAMLSSSPNPPASDGAPDA